MAKRQVAASINDHIAGFPEETRDVLEELRALIRAAAPDATEKMSYAIPSYYLNGNLVHFAAFKKHIGFYPAPSGIENFKEELAKYKTSKGAIQFPLDEEIPLNLVREIVRFRLQENLKKAKK